MEEEGGGGHYDYFPFLRSAFALLSIYVRYFVYLLRSAAGLGTVFFAHPEIPFIFQATVFSMF